MAGFWWIGLATNAVVAAAFIAVAVVLAVNAIRTKQVRHNPLGLATVILYLSCGGGHVVHTLQLMDGLVGPQTLAGAAIRLEYDTNIHMWIIDILTAAAGISYWMMRRRFPALVSGAAVFEDLRTRQRRALEIHDDVVQGLVHAKMALDLDQRAEGEQAVGDTLVKARHIIDELLEKETMAKSDRKPAVPLPGGSHGL